MITNAEEFEEFLKGREYKYSFNNDGTMELAFRGDVARYRIVVKIDEGRTLQIFGYSPVVVPEGARNDVSVAVVCANYGLILGKFSLDVRDGDLHFQISVPFAGKLPEEGVLDRVLLTPVAMLDRYVPAFLSVMYGNEQPQEAVALAEA